MRRRPSRTSGCFGRFAGRESLTLHPTFAGVICADCPGFKKWSIASPQIYRFVRGIAVDALVFEFMGLAMLALCVVVLAVPSRRPPAARHIREY
jgi:hypothetical protein